MAASASQIEAWLEAAEAALFQGIRVVEHNGKRVGYQSTADLQRAVNAAQAKLDRLNGTEPTSMSTIVNWKE